MSILKDQIDRSEFCHVANYSYRPQYINNQQNILKTLCCISFTISSPTSFGRYCCHLQRWCYFYSNTDGTKWC